MVSAEGAPEPVGPTEFRCPACDTVVPGTAPQCPTCGADFMAAAPPSLGPRSRSVRRLRAEYSEADVSAIARIPGVGPAVAERLCKAGFSAPWKIAAASVDDLAKVPGVGSANARTVKDSIQIVLILPKRRTREEILAEESACPLCGCVTSRFSRRCHDCGAEFDDEEIERALRAELRAGAEKSELAFYEVRILENQADPDLWYARGMLFRDMGQLPEAISSFDRALELAPDAPRVLLARAAAMAQVREVAKASKHLQDSIGGLVHEAAAKLAWLEDRGIEVETIAALSEVEAPRCPVCGEPVLPGATVCPACNASLIPAPEGAADAEVEEPGPEAGPEVVQPIPIYEPEPPSVDEPPMPPPPPPAPEFALVPEPPETAGVAVAPESKAAASARESSMSKLSSLLSHKLRAALPFLAPAAVLTGAGAYGVSTFAATGGSLLAMAALMVAGAVSVSLGIALRRPA